jgi:hypothetical protein
MVPGVADVQNAKRSNCCEEVEMTDLKMVEGLGESRLMSLVESINDGYKAMAELLHLAYINDLYLGWGFESIFDFAEQRLGMSVRSTQWILRVWITFKRLQEGGESWVMDLSWPVMKELARLPDPKMIVESREMIENSTWQEVSHAVAAKLNELADDARDGNNVSQEIGDSLDGTGVDASWLRCWIRDNTDLVKEFIDKECV